MSDSKSYVECLESGTLDTTAPFGGDAEEIGVFPVDAHNAKLLDLVAPRNWTNPTPADDFVYDVIAIGAGAGGLVTSKQAARRGAKSALIEKHLAGGDCLNVGCVPSKALLRCARSLRDVKHAAKFGVTGVGSNVAIDFAAVMARLRRLRTRIAPADSFAGAKKVGVDVYQGHAVFTGPNTLKVGNQTLRFKNAVIATGGRAFVPPLPGLKGTPYLTNANLYNLTELPKSMLVLGGGPIGSEMGQAFATFGTKVTIVSDYFLMREDDDAREVVKQALIKEGVQFVLGHLANKVEYDQKTKMFRVHAPDGKGGATVVEGEQLLVSTGRMANTQGLGLEAAEVKYTRRGVTINDFMQTSNPSVWAVGDVATMWKFTHMSGQMAIMVVDNILFGENRKVSEFVIPRVTYTEPEVAAVGTQPWDREVKEGQLDTYKASLEHNDRAILEGATEGFFKLHCNSGTDRIVGATIVGAMAGEMINHLTMCVQFNIPISHSGLGSLIYAYPTMASGAGSCMWGYKMKTWKKLDAEGNVIGGPAPQADA